MTFFHPLSLSLSLSLIQYLPHTLALSLFHCKIQEHRSITIVNAQMFPSFVANKYNKHLSCAIDIIHTCSSTCMVLNCSFVGLDRIAFSFSLATTVPSTQFTQLTCLQSIEIVQIWIFSPYFFCHPPPLFPLPHISEQPDTKANQIHTQSTTFNLFYQILLFHFISFHLLQKKNQKNKKQKKECALINQWIKYTFDRSTQ